MGYDAENSSLRIPALENNRHGETLASAQNGTQDLERLPSPSLPRTRQRIARSSGLWMFGLALLAFAVRASGILYGFVFDDVFNIEHRPAVDLSHLPASLPPISPRPSDRIFTARF